MPTATRGHRRRGLRFTSTTARVAAMTRTRRCGIRSIVCIISFTKVTNPEGPAGDTGSAPTWCTSNSLTEPLPASVHGNISHLTTHAGTGPTYRLRSGTISGGITRLYSPAQPRSSTASSSFCIRASASPKTRPRARTRPPPALASRLTPPCQRTLATQSSPRGA